MARPTKSDRKQKAVERDRKEKEAQEALVAEALQREIKRLVIKVDYLTLVMWRFDHNARNIDMSNPYRVIYGPTMSALWEQALEGPRLTRGNDTQREDPSFARVKGEGCR